MAKIGSLSVVLSLTSAKFSQGMKAAQMQVKGFRAAMRGTRTSLNRFGRALAVPAATIGGVGAALALMVKRSMAGIDATSKFSQRIGIAIDRLRGLELAAELSGVKVNTLHLALQRMTRRISEAAQGTGEAQKALIELGLDAERLNRLAVDEQFVVLAEAMESVINQSDRVRLAMRLFDSEGVAVVNTMRGGAAAIQKAFEQSEEFGNSLQAIDAAKIEVAKDAFTRVSIAIGGLQDQLTIGMTGALTALAKVLEDWSKDAIRNIDDISARVQRGIGTGVTVGGGVLGILRNAWRGIRGGGQLLLGGLAATAMVPTALSPNVQAALSNVAEASWSEGVRKISDAFKGQWDILSGAQEERIKAIMHEADIRRQAAIAERLRSMPETGMPASTELGALLQEMRLIRQSIENLGTMPE